MDPKFVPYAPERLPEDAMVARAREFRDLMRGRRSVRMFSAEPFPREILDACLETAGTAPSGAHKQPWTFVVVADPAVKQRIREAAEGAERRFYGELAPDEWLRDLAPLGTDWVKTHLTDAPYLVVVFAQDYGLDAAGHRTKHYYVNESVGIAVGFFLAAVRNAGLCALTHTPAPMGFLRRILDRPENERAYVLIPVGYAARDARVPDIRRKPFGAYVASV
jgi:nitroreductase